MSNEWNFYPCQMGDRSASIFYDHGIRETINQSAATHFLWVKVGLKQPRLDGLSAREEYDALCALEDDLQAVGDSTDSIYVGRITVDGNRYFHLYTEGSEADWSPRLKALGSRHGYDVRFSLKEDAERNGYWRELFPSDDDWQVIQDLKVLDALGKQGDDGSASRQIDHWAYFNDDDAAEQFLNWLATEKYSTKGSASKEDGRICIRFSHEGSVQLSDITAHTIALRRKAHEIGGDYDGWETQVCKVEET